MTDQTITDTTPLLDENSFETIDVSSLRGAARSSHSPRILMLYGSARETSYSRLLTFEAQRILNKLGCET
ncbi:MAG: arsenical resistance protein ArsH, partial [Pseudomonadota bacterium]